jgi:hypothetical protein
VTTPDAPAPTGADEPAGRDGPPRTLLIAALVLAVGATAAIVIVARVVQRTPPPTPVAVSAAPAPRADSPPCHALTAALPESLGSYRRATLVEPAPAGAAAWQADGDGDPLVLRCGLDRPADFVIGAPLQVVDDVQWFRVADSGADGRSTWFTVDRPVYVALTLPAGSGPDAIQTLSTVIATVMPAVPLDPGPPR